MEFSSLEYFIKVINEHIWVIAGYPLMQFDVNGVQFRILTICKIIRSQFSEQVAAPRDWKHYVPIVYLIVFRYFFRISIIYKFISRVEIS